MITFGTGNPQAVGLEANAGDQYIDLGSGNLYRETQIPKGKQWQQIGNVRNLLGLTTEATLLALSNKVSTAQNQVTGNTSLASLDTKATTTNEKLASINDKASILSNTVTSISFTQDTISTLVSDVNEYLTGSDKRFVSISWFSDMTAFYAVVQEI